MNIAKICSIRLELFKEINMILFKGFIVLVFRVDSSITVHIIRDTYTSGSQAVVPRGRPVYASGCLFTNLCSI